MIKINDYVYQLENEVVEYVRDQVYHESLTYYSDSEIKEFQENAVNSRICDLEEILDVDKVLKMNEKVKSVNRKSLIYELQSLENLLLKKPPLGCGTPEEEEERVGALNRMNDIEDALSN